MSELLSALGLATVAALCKWLSVESGAKVRLIIVMCKHSGKFFLKDDGNKRDGGVYVFIYQAIAEYVATKWKCLHNYLMEPQHRLSYMYRTFGKEKRTFPRQI